MRLSGHAAFEGGSSRAHQEAVAVVRRALELGVNHIDTAAFYFSPAVSANNVIATALASHAGHVTIATKVGPWRDADGAWRPAATPQQLRGQVEENLRQLGREHLDLVYLRMQNRGPLTDHLGALVDLVSAGLVRHLGVSAVDERQLSEARQMTPIIAVQNRYSLDDRAPSAQQILDTCGREGIAFVPYFSIAGTGREQGRSASTDREDTGVQEVAAARGVSAAQVRIAWSLHQGAHVLAIPGTGRIDHLEENLAAQHLELTEKELACLGAHDR